MLKETMQNIERLQAEIASYGEFPKEVLKQINYKLRLDWNYYSNSMEGGTLTREETRSVMSGVLNLRNKSKKDFHEMEGHDKLVLDVLKLSKGEMRLSETRIKEIHSQIMYAEIPDIKAQIGEWKTTDNEIINYKNEKISFAPFTEVPRLVHELMDKLNTYLDHYLADHLKVKKHPLEVVSDFHIDFLTIHPFFDGNGRVARVLSNLILIACGYPIFIVKTEDKDVYGQLLADIQVYGGNRNQFVDFIGEQVIATQDIILKALKGESIEDEDDLDKELEMLKRKQIITPKPIKKSKQSIIDTVQNVYLPLLKEIDKIGLKFSSLFEAVHWNYYIDPNSIKGYVSGNLPAVFKKLTEEANQVDFDLFEIKLNLYFLKYKDDKAFSAELAIRINFYDEKFNIEVMTGIPLESGVGFTLVKGLIEAFSTAEEREISDGENVQILESNYGRELTESELKEYSTQIGKVLLNFIKNKAKKK